MKTLALYALLMITPDGESRVLDHGLSLEDCQTAKVEVESLMESDSPEGLTGYYDGESVIMIGGSTVITCAKHIEVE